MRRESEKTVSPGRYPHEALWRYASYGARKLNHHPQVASVSQCSPSLHGCPALCLVVPVDGSPAALRYCRWCGLTLRKERDDGSSRHINILGRPWINSSPRAPHHYLWGKYVVCERGL